MVMALLLVVAPDGAARAFNPIGLKQRKDMQRARWGFERRLSAMPLVI
jgi:hypothetical protein